MMSNPGSMLVSVNEFYEGQHSVCRNPLLQKMFVFIGVGEKAGSGADVIVKGWEDQKWMKPVIEEHFEPDRVEIVMRMVKEDGVESTPAGKESTRSWQGVSKEIGVDFYVLERLAKYCREARSLAEIAKHLGFADRYKMKKKFIDPLLGDYLEMTRPDVPNSRLQQYVLTEQGKELLKKETDGMQAAGVSKERVNLMIEEFAEALPRFPIGLPWMEEQFKNTLPIEDVRCFYVPYLMKKEMFKDNGSWICDTPELYLAEIQANIWQHYHLKFLAPDVRYQIHFSEIKEAFKALGLDGRYAVITSFQLGTFDAHYGGDISIKETEYGYLYGEIPIYRVPWHEARMIVMKKVFLPRCESKEYEGEDNKYKLINEQHLLYSNIFNMKEEQDGLGLIMMRNLKFYLPNEKDFHYVKLIVDRMDRAESELGTIKPI